MAKKARCLRVGLFVLAALFMGILGQVHAEEKYPSRAIDLIVPWGPGGSTDLSTRIVAAYLNKKWGVPVNVVNKPGGNTVPGVLEVYQASPDGYTLLTDAPGSSSTLGLVVKTLPFKIMDRTFIAVAGIAPNLLMVGANSPYKKLEDVIADAKKEPENFRWASMGGVSTADIGIRQLLKAIGVDVLVTKPIMASGTGGTTALVGGGHVKIGCNTTSAVMPSIRGGMVRVLAITGDQRYPDLPDVPTFGELGYPSIDVLTWVGIAGPPNVGAHVIETWNKAMVEMVKDPEVISKFKNIGARPFYLNAKDFKEYVRREIEVYEKLYSK